jgi:hypothetical protein
MRRRTRSATITSVTTYRRRSAVADVISSIEDGGGGGREIGFPPSCVPREPRTPPGRALAMLLVSCAMKFLSGQYYVHRVKSSEPIYDGFYCINEYMESFGFVLVSDGINENIGLPNIKA